MGVTSVWHIFLHILSFFCQIILEEKVLLLLLYSRHKLGCWLNDRRRENFWNGSQEGSFHVSFEAVREAKVNQI